MLSRRGNICSPFPHQPSRVKSPLVDQAMDGCHPGLKPPASSTIPKPGLLHLGSYIHSFWPWQRRKTALSLLCIPVFRFVSGDIRRERQTHLLKGPNWIRNDLEALEIGKLLVLCILLPDGTVQRSV